MKANHEAVDAFFATVVAATHELERERKRRRLARQQIFTLKEAAALTGLTIEEVRDHINDECRLHTDPNTLTRDEVFSLALMHAEENNCQAGLDYLELAVPEETVDHLASDRRLFPYFGV